MKTSTLTNRFAMLPEHVVVSTLTPREKAVWAALAFRAGPNIDEVWAHVKSLAAELYCCLDTIRRALRSLTRQGFLFSTGKRHHGRHNIYRLAWDEVQNVTPTEKALPHNPPLEKIAQATAPLEKGVECHIPPLKKIAQVTPPLEKGAGGFSVLTNDPIIKKLTQKGILTQVAKNLIDEFGEENCTKQLEHLRVLQKNGTMIKDPARWLVVAIRKNYQVAISPSEPKAPEPAPLVEIPQEKPPNHDEAAQILAKARERYMLNDFVEAMNLVQQSMVLCWSAAAHNLKEQIESDYRVYQNYLIIKEHLDENTLKYLYDEALSECCIGGKTKAEILSNAQETATVDFLLFNKANRFFREQNRARRR